MSEKSRLTRESPARTPVDSKKPHAVKVVSFEEWLTRLDAYIAAKEAETR